MNADGERASGHVTPTRRDKSVARRSQPADLDTDREANAGRPSARKLRREHFAISRFLYSSHGVAPIIHDWGSVKLPKTIEVSYAIRCYGTS